MIEFDEALDDCLHDLASGASTLDECLLRHPRHAAQLEPLLTAAITLQKGQGIHPSAAFKARARAKLTMHMQEHPRSRPRTIHWLQRFASGLAVIVLTLLLTGTVYAQGALPGDTFYSWKLASERAWRAIAPDHVATDIAIANRRIDEMNAVGDDPVRRAQALGGYLEVVTRLESELDAETLKRILPAIDSIEESGSSIPVPTNTTTATPPPVTDTPMPALPEVIPTVVPEIIPTIQFPPLLP